MHQREFRKAKRTYEILRREIARHVFLKAMTEDSIELLKWMRRQMMVFNEIFPEFEESQWVGGE